eukprot:m.120278 g.120278  ORF g.120278 m.120278 type:complete len:138 (+) comp13685_c0_seq1:2113-2526(+)
MAEEPVAVIADVRSKKVDLEEGKTYYWCTCGKSKNQPFCDGSHKGTGFKPKAFTAEKTETRGLCMCKATKNAPFCDGTHRQPEVLQAYIKQLLQSNSALTDQLVKKTNESNHYKTFAQVATVLTIGLGVLFALKKAN